MARKRSSSSPRGNNYPEVKVQCRICGKMGNLGPDIVITANGYEVHHGECHQELIRISKKWLWEKHGIRTQ